MFWVLCVGLLRLHSYFGPSVKIYSQMITKPVRILCTPIERYTKKNAPIFPQTRRCAEYCSEILAVSRGLAVALFYSWVMRKCNFLLKTKYTIRNCGMHAMRQCCAGGSTQVNLMEWSGWATLSLNDARCRLRSRFFSIFFVVR